MNRKDLVVLFLIPSLIPDSFITFFSGICLSAAINIATSQIPQKIWILPLDIIISMMLMFISSLFFMIWAFKVKPLQEKYKEGGEKGFGIWFQYVCPKPDRDPNKPCKKIDAVQLILFSFISFGTGIASICLLLWYDYGYSNCCK